MVILAEELLLLALDEETGRAKGIHLKEAMAAALLVDLWHANRIELRHKRVTVADPTPVGHAALDRLLDTIGKQTWDLKPRSHVANNRRDIQTRVADGLVGQHVLRPAAPGEARWKPIRSEVLVEARRRLEAMMDSGVAPDARTAALGGLVRAGRLEKVVLPRHRRREARGVLKSAAREGPAAADREAVGLILRGVMLAVVCGAQGNGAGSIGE